jgi:hypothetical protein
MSPQTLFLLITNECSGDIECEAIGHILDFQIGTAGTGPGNRTASSDVFHGWTDPMTAWNAESRYRSEFYDIRNPLETCRTKVTCLALPLISTCHSASLLSLTT